MARRGAHELTSNEPTYPRNLAREADGEDSDIGSALGALFLLFLLLSGIAQCANAPSAPNAPPPPQARYAAFTSSELGPAPALKIVLEGGTYDITYHTVDQMLLPGLPGDRVFTADFTTGKVSGDLDTAELVVLRGNVALRTGVVSHDDRFQAELALGSRVSAHFRYAQSPRGPPDDSRVVHKRIAIVGKLTSIDIGEAHGNAERRISVLELDPTEEERHHYEMALALHEAEMQRHRAHEYSRRGGIHR